MEHSQDNSTISDPQKERIRRRPLPDWRGGGEGRKSALWRDLARGGEAADLLPDQLSLLVGREERHAMPSKGNFTTERAKGIVRG